MPKPRLPKQKLSAVANAVMIVIGCVAGVSCFIVEGAYLLGRSRLSGGQTIAVCILNLIVAIAFLIWGGVE